MSHTNGSTREVCIAGMGTYLPQRRVFSEELDRIFGVEHGWTAKATGVLERRYVEHETTEGMAARAACLALDDARIAPEAVDVVIAASSSPRQRIPCTAVFVHRELGLPQGSSMCFDIDATCLSWLTAVDLASTLIVGGRARVVLLVTSEMGSRSLNPAEPESAGLFGDAAVAAVLTATAPGQPSRVGHSLFQTHSCGADLAEFTGGGTRHHPNDPDTRPDMNMFHMQGRAIFKMARRVVPPFLDRFFHEVGTDRSQFHAVVPHQASRLGIAALTEQFGFAERQVITNLATRGNCIAASIPLALAEAVWAGAIARGDRVLLTGTGAGLSIGAIDLVY
jgi:3-oxoacyl-[acyl-carrier-protein] synthase-3